MYELADTTTPKLKPIITKFYSRLFDNNKTFTELKGFTSLEDYGVVASRFSNYRKLGFKYGGINYVLELSSYIRENGNTISIREISESTNYIQYVLDKFIELEG